MKYISGLKEGMHVSEVYLCKTKILQLTKAGKEYESLTLQDRTGTVDAKIWDLASPGIDYVEAHDYVAIEADVTAFNGSLQLNIKRIRKADEGEYYPSDYLPVSERDSDEMYAEILKEIDSVKNKYLNALLKEFFVNDGELVKKIRFSSAAKTIHHSFVGGLMEHTTSVVKMCEYLCKQYPYLNHDLLISAAMLHDIGKVREFIPFPYNDYSDEGQLVGHIVIGSEMIEDKASKIPDFPEKIKNELKHCIIAHHGELEFGSPKKPALAEALALSLADNTDAKLETMKETLLTATSPDWMGYNKFFDSNIRKTSDN